MNKKTREVIETLLAVLDDSCSCEPEDATQKEIDDARAHYAKKGAAIAAAIAAAEKLLNPPVRFAWSRRCLPGSPYVAEIADVRYEVKPSFLVSGTGWCATANGKPLSAVYSTLAQAKQACVDYGVARTKAKREARP